MAAVRRLAAGGVSVKASDTELELLRSCLRETASMGHIAIEGLDPEDQRMIREALILRERALHSLQENLGQFDPEDGEEYE